MSNELAKISSQEIAKLDEITAQDLAMVQADVTKKFTAAMMIAAQVNKIKNALSPAIMQETILPLKDCGSLGFGTDEGQRNTPYPVEIVKTCVTEALLRGAQLVGGEFMIFQGKTFFTKNYFERKVRTFPGISNLDITCSTPKMMSGGAVLECKATFSLHGKPIVIDRTGVNAIAIRLQGSQGSDAAIGKAEKRMYRFILNYVTGYAPPADPDDEDSSTLKVVGGTSVVSNNPVDDGPQASDPVQEAPKSEPVQSTNEAVKKTIRTVKAAKAQPAVVLPPPEPKEEPQAEVAEETPTNEVREPGDESEPEQPSEQAPEEPLEEPVEEKPAAKDGPGPKVVKKIVKPGPVTWIEKNVKLRAKCDGIDFVSTVKDHGVVFAKAVQQNKDVAVEYKFIDKENVVQSVTII